MSPEKIARNWMQEVAVTAAAGDLEAHMDLVSKRVQVVGEPGFDGIDYADWVRQCSHEFENRLLKGVDYRGFKLLAHTDARIMFKTYETVTGTDGTVNAQGIEVLLELEDDGKWRVTQERILPPDEVEHDGLLA
jgi:hypothetical protein